MNITNKYTVNIYPRPRISPANMLVFCINIHYFPSISGVKPGSPLSPKQKKTPVKPRFYGIKMVAEMGFEPHDLRVMSPTSYQAAPLRDMVPETGLEPVRDFRLTGF